jgi:hypothetical protein
VRLQLIRATRLATTLTLVVVTASAQDEAARKPSSTVAARASAQTTAYSDSDHVTVITPVVSGQVSDATAGWSVRGQYLVDTISAASVDIVSTASSHWRETRQAGSVDASYKPETVGAQASAAFSSEPDYLSFAAGGVLSWDVFRKSHTLFLGYALDHDTIGRTGTPFRVYSHTLLQHTFDAGVTLTLNRAAVLSLVGDLMIERGDQSKPYRYIPMFAPDVARTIEKGESINEVNAKRLPERPLEQLPLSRERYALSARFGYRFAHATLRIDERIYTDTWQLHASTSELRYYADLSRRTMIWPHFRFHAQSATYFWRRAYVSEFSASEPWLLPQYRTGDRELGPLSTLGAGVGASFKLGDMDRSPYTLILQGDMSGTEFLDDLYVTSRLAGFCSIGLEGAFE